MAAEFDDHLKQRLLAFQTHHGLTGDGVAGAETWQALVAGAHGQPTNAGHHGGGGGTGTCDCEVDDTGTPGGNAHLDDTEPPELLGVLAEPDAEHDDAAPDGAVAIQVQARGRRHPQGPSPVPASCRSSAKACFSISQHTAWLLRPGRVVVVAVPALGGRSGHPTPTGQFTVNFHDEHHVSSIYHAPMPFYVNFAPQVGFHAGSLSVQSHGCVHLSRDNARRFFHYLNDGDPVDVVP